VDKLDGNTLDFLREERFLLGIVRGKVKVDHRVSILSLAYADAAHTGQGAQFLRVSVLYFRCFVRVRHHSRVESSTVLGQSNAQGFEHLINVVCDGMARRPGKEQGHGLIGSAL
jgi:hypothetical protein